MGQIGRETKLLFVDTFLQNYHLDSVAQLLTYHKDYLDVYCRTHNFILKGDGPLPYHYRHYIAIMAAGRHRCSYIINHQKQEFLLQCGDPTWLQGLQHIPKKLRDLNEINKILAHRPWLLNVTHIQRLTKGADSWSLAELVHAIVLLAHFHALSSFIFGSGINEEIVDECLEVDLDSYIQQQQTSPQKLQIPERPTKPPSPSNILTTTTTPRGMPVEELMQRMRVLSEREQEFSQEEKTKRFEHVENQCLELSPGIINSPPTQLNDSMRNFIEDPYFIYQDFAKRGDIPTFRVQDYSWDDHGYSLVNRLYNDVGTLLDEKFKTAYNLTYFMMGGRRQVDTSRFRRAIWNYIQCMFGIRHDDYDYGEVNQLLERSVKTFIKMVCCYPELVKPKDYERVMREFEHSEKIHVNLMVMEARMQGELLYALRAVMRYQT